jgi:hypothetical protein
MKQWLGLFVPGQRALAAAITPVLIIVDHALKLGIPDGKVAWAAVPLAAYILGHFFQKKGGEA